MRFYVYCLVESVGSLPHSRRGVGGAPVRLLEHDEFSLLVSDYADDRVPVTREDVLAHAAVIQDVLKQTTPLPFRFGTLASEEQLQNYLNARRDSLKLKLEHVRGCVEMSVKIIWDRNWKEEAAAVTHEQKPGTTFLAEKRREILGGEVRAAEAKRIAEWLERQIGEIVREIDIKTNPTIKLIVAAAYLVERDRVEEFRQRLAEVRAQRPELHFLVSGPWAPYSFADVDLEFKTQFGVS